MAKIRADIRSFAPLALTALLLTSVSLQQASFAGESTQTDIKILIDGPIGAQATKAAGTSKTKSRTAVTSPNPWLSFLPAEVEPDYDGWKPILKEKAESRARSLQKIQQASGLANVTINQSEIEPSNAKGQNDTLGTAEPIGGFGTGDGDDPAADVNGNLRAPNPPSTITPNAEDDGDINKATATSLGDDAAVIASATIGDGPFGSAQVTLDFTNVDSEDDSSITDANDTGLTQYVRISEAGTIGDGPAGSSGTGTGDWDFYFFEVDGRQVVTFELEETTTGFRPLLAIYRNDGQLFSVFDDAFSPGQILLTAEFTTTGGPANFYFAVGGNTNPGGNPANEILSDPFDGSTGVGTSASSEGTYNIQVEFTPPGDFDVYQVSLNAGDYVTAEVDTDPYGGFLDPIVAVFDSNGDLIAFNDDGIGEGTQLFDSLLAFVAPLPGDYYFFVGGFSFFPTSIDSFPEDAFDSSSGPGFGAEGNYDLILSRNTLDIDIYSFEADAGDVIGLNMSGSARFIDLLNPAGTTLVGSASDSSGIYPPASLLPGGGVASSAYVIPESGTHYALIFGGDGAYSFELRGFRSPQEASGTKQTIFIDFDGATLDTTIFSSSGFVDATLSPLVDFLPGWGLTAGDLDAVIDAILAEVERSLKDDIAANGLNPGYDVEILNSRDHADPFGDPNVSRVIVGGTQAESGIQTIGIAQSIDPGNFETEETALVLLDLLSAAASNPNSLNQYPLTGGATIIDLIGTGVGNIVAHEAGHFLANFHTDNSNILPNIMDTGGNLANLVGVGVDGQFGSGDDVQVVFEADTYDPFEGFFGVEDTKNAIAWALFGPGASPLPLVYALPDVNSNGFNDLAILREGSVIAEVRDGQSGTLLNNIGFFGAGGFTPIAATPLDDADGNGVSELAVLATRDSDGRIAVEMRNVTGAPQPRQLFFAPNSTPITLVAINDDADNNNVPEIAVLSTRDSDDRGQIEIKNAFGATNPRALFAGAGLTPSDLDIIPDADNNGVPEVAILSTRDSDGRIVVEIKNAAGATLPNAVWFMPGNTAIDLAVVPDKDNNGVPEVAVLSSRNSDGRIVTEIKNASGATQPSAVWFAVGHTALQLAAVGDSDSNNVPEVAVLSTRDSDGRILVEVKNAAGATSPRALWYSPGFAARSLTILDDVDNNGIEEAGVLMIRDSDGRILVQGRNTAGTQGTKNFWFSP